MDKAMMKMIRVINIRNERDLFIADTEFLGLDHFGQ